MPKANSNYSLILAPEGAVVPEDLQHLVFDGPDIIAKIAAGAEKQQIVTVNTRELQLIVEYRDLFGLDCVAIIGLQGAMYSTVWNTYVATMEREPVDSLRMRIKEQHDASADAGTAAVIAPSRESRVARLVRPPVAPTAADESDFTGD